MAGTSNSITTHNVLSGVLNADNVISGLVNTAFNPAYALVTQAGAQIVLFINNNDYKMYAQLKDKSGNLIYTSNIIDLPLETMVVDGRYDSNTKKLILVLDNGNEIEVPLEALINGLVNEDDLIANYYDKDEIDALLNGYWTKIELTQEDIDNWNAKQEYLNQGDGIEISADTILKGNTRQESTTGKNLLNIFNFEMGAMSNGSIMSSPYRINNVNNPIEVKPNTTYCISSVLSTQVKGMRCGIHECDENMTFKKDSDWQQLATNPYVFTTENYTKYVKIVFTLSTTSTNVQTNITEDVTSYNNAVDWARGCLFQLEEGNTATNWEPYTGGNPAPNPDYPYPVNVVTGDNEVEVRANSNLQSGEQLYQTMYAYNSSNVIEVTDGTINAIRFNPYYYRPLGGTNEFNVYNNWKENTQYTIRVKAKRIESIGLYLQALYTDGTNSTSQITGSTTEYTELRFVTSANKTIQRVGFSYGTQGEWLLDKSSWYIGEGVQTEYPEYNGTTYPINLGSMELCKIGDYQDYLYKENGIWYKYGAIGKTEVNLTGNVGSLPNSNKYNAFVPTNKAQIYGNLCYCNKANYNQDNPQDGQFYQNVPNVVYVGNSTDTLATLKQKYDGSLLYYVLNTPTTTEITDTTLISQLNALTTGFSNNWVKNISQTNTDLPFEIEYDNTNLTISASSNLVRNTDYANYSTAGVVKSNLSFETDNNGGARCSIIEYSNYPSANNRNFISKGTLENVITGKELTNKTYVDAADAAFESELFDDGIISVEDVTKASINNTMNKSQLKINLKGNTSQESTTGKNLLKPLYVNNPFTKDGVTWTYTEQGWKFNGTLTKSLSYSDICSVTLPAGTYTINGITGGSGTTYQVVLFVNDNLIAYITNTNHTFTLEESSVVRTRLYIYQNYGTFNNLILPYQLETGSTATDYEPYTGGNPAPNPDYPYPVNVVTGDNEVKVEGKNLLGLTNGTYSNNGITAIVNNGEITLSGTANGTSFVFVPLLQDIVLLNQTITLSTNNISAGGDSLTEMRLYTSGSRFLPCAYNTINNSVVYTNKTDTYNKVQIRTSSGVSYNNLVLKPMLEKGNTHTTYEPYQSQTYPINLGSMELCKIGDYQDYLYKENGVWCKYGAIGKVVLDGSEQWAGGTSGAVSSNYTYVYTSAYDNLIKTSFYEAKCNKLNNLGTWMGINTQVNTDTIAIGDPGSNKIRIMILTSRLSEQTTTGFKNWLTENKPEVYYVLSTPTITTITDTTLIEQLDNLEKAYSYDTQTNISQTNQDKSFILDINAIADNVNGLKLENENQEYKTNKVIELSSNSTDDEYPSAKCVYDIVGNIEAVLAAMDSGSGV